jgi:hypothetical protein
MSTAILYTGQARTFKRCFASQYWNVLRKMPEPHFFCSVADDEDAGDMELLRTKFEHVFIEKLEQPVIMEPDHHLVDHAPYRISTSVQGVLRQLWALSRGWNFMQVQAGAAEFSRYVRIRPDLFFHRCEPPTWRLQYHEAFLPWWGGYGGVNDRFAIMGPDAAKAYFTTFEKLSTLFSIGCPLHPESLIRASLEAAGCVIREKLSAEFSCLREDGQRVWPEYVPADLYRYLALQ